MGAADPMEETMRLLTYLELSRYSKSQLRLLHHEMLCALSILPIDAPLRETALLNIRHIRLFLDRREYRLKMRL